MPGPTTEAVAEAARTTGTVVVLGVNERAHGTLYNAELFFDGDAVWSCTDARSRPPTTNE